MRDSSTSSETQPPCKAARRSLALVALGIVFGDIATSPLYAVKECFSGPFGIAATPNDILGILSLMVWSLLLVVSVKYLLFILRADSDGEGGVLVLASLVFPKKNRSKSALFAFGLFAACLLYGDGVITPAISVLSAVEGVREIAPRLDQWIVPITVAILIGLFAIQRFGTQNVGRYFGPVIGLWLVVIATAGAVSISQTPQILAALNPIHGLRFLVTRDFHGYLVLGAVFLVVTGGEALYADLGHFGRGPIRFAWFAFTLPALLLNYFGQGAHLLRSPQDVAHPFYSLIPDALGIPMIILATLATIIASQAVISGAFSLTRQAIQLGYLPRMKIVHTSADHEGQIYIPLVNYALAAATIGAVIGFGSSSHLAAAYGVAVSAAMLVSTVLFFLFLRRRWKWSLPLALVLCGSFFIIDFGFFIANISKFFHGGWFPLIIAGLIFFIMTSWRSGLDAIRKSFPKTDDSLETQIAKNGADLTRRVPGIAVFLCSSADSLSRAFIHNLEHNHVIHEKVVFLHVAVAEVPRVKRSEKLVVTEVGEGFTRITASYGFMEMPNVLHILAMARESGADLAMEKVSFFLGDSNVTVASHSTHPRWRSSLFCWLNRNAQSASAYFSIPSTRAIEIGTCTEI